ncbi:hypothetical protein [Cohnella lupini]|uniref:hypothetical protein n=1 Tax=Cohnella lupini TaxID=1294267 RepID=UPI0015F26A5A|nr:hypothetical protein [Cohnella lupini]
MPREPTMDIDLFFFFPNLAWRRSYDFLEGGVERWSALVTYPCAKVAPERNSGC